MNLSRPSASLRAAFRLANLAVLPAWGLLIAAPRSRWTQALLKDDSLLLGLGGLYGAFLGAAFRENTGGAAAVMNPTLENIAAMMRNGGYKGAAAGWIHYLVFDFFVGRSILQDAQERGIPHSLVVPALLMTLASGPLGLAYYRILVRLRGAR